MERGARHHGPDVGETVVGPDAPRTVGEAEPDAPTALDRAGERAVVDELAPDRGEAADALVRFAAQQHASARRRRGPGRRIVDPGKRIELLEEEYEGGNQKLFPTSLGAQPNHQ